MAERSPRKANKKPHRSEDEQTGAATNTVTPTRRAPEKSPPRTLPPWKILLHNDQVNDMLHVVETIIMLTPLKQPEAVQRMFDAHRRGVTLLLTTHRERAELYQQQFASRNLTVTIEPA